MGMSSGPAPTRTEAARMNLIVLCGCVACFQLGRYVPCEVHHLTVGGKHGAPRRGHVYTVGLCAWHHRGFSEVRWQRMHDLFGPSYARDPRAFRATFGSDDALLKIQSARLRVRVADYLIKPVYAEPPECL